LIHSMANGVPQELERVTPGLRTSRENVSRRSLQGRERERERETHLDSVMVPDGLGTSSDCFEPAMASSRAFLACAALAMSSFLGLSGPLLKLMLALALALPSSPGDNDGSRSFSQRVAPVLLTCCDPFGLELDGGTPLSRLAARRAASATAGGRCRLSAVSRAMRSCSRLMASCTDRGTSRVGLRAESVAGAEPPPLLPPPVVFMGVRFADGVGADRPEASRPAYEVDGDGVNA